ncbi:MAG: hypothetical protein AAFX06_28300 [Planctomycetota bacterium]
MAESHFEKTIELVAKAIEVHPRTVKGWLAQGAPGETESGYDVEAIKRWREENVRSRPGDEPEPDIENYRERMAAAKLGKAEAEERKISAEAEIKKFDAQKLADNLCYIEDVENWVSFALTRLRNGLAKIPAQLAAGYAPDIRHQLEGDCRERIEIELRAIVSDLSDVGAVRDE